MVNKAGKVKYTTQPGVITVEASIALPIFLGFFFLLLYLTKAACIMLALDHAAVQTARHLAAASYPLAIIDEYVEERIEEKVSQVISGKMPENTLSRILWGIQEEEDAESLLQTVMTSLTKEAGREAERLIKDNLLSQYNKLVQGGKNQLAAVLVQHYLDARLLNPDKLSIQMVKLPIEKTGLSQPGKAEEYAGTGLVPDDDFSEDDVVIQLEYELSLPIPFYRDRPIRLVATAIERAWLQGGDGVYTEKEEGLDWLKKGSQAAYVYKARNGTKYHLFKDCAYLQKSCLPLTKDEALEQGLDLHKNCPYRF